MLLISELQDIYCIHTLPYRWRFPCAYWPHFFRLPRKLATPDFWRGAYHFIYIPVFLQAMIYHGGKSTYVGHFATEEEAALTRGCLLKRMGLTGRPSPMRRPAKRARDILFEGEGTCTGNGLDGGGDEGEESGPGISYDAETRLWKVSFARLNSVDTSTFVVVFG